MRYDSKGRIYGERIVSALIGVFFVAPLMVTAATMYGAGTLLQPGDVTSSHILDGQIVNNDVSASAAISATKIAGGGAGGHLMFSASNQLATSSDLTYSTSTRTFSSLGTTTLAASTTINGVNYYWPNSQGSANQIIQNDGTGRLAWTNAASSRVSASFTAGEAITAGDAIVIGQASTTSATGGGTATTEDVSDGSSRVAQRFTTPASPLVGINYAICYATDGSAGAFPAFTGEIRTDSSGSPGTLVTSATKGGIDLFSGPGSGYQFDFSGAPVTLSPSTNYWFVCYPHSNPNGVAVQRNNSAGQNTKKSTNSGSSFSDINGAMKYTINYTITEAGRVYRANATNNDFYANAFIGLAQSTVTAGQSVTVDMGGLSTATSTATAGTTYYLCNTAGALCTTAGSQSRKVGLGLGSLGFLIKHDNP